MKLANANEIRSELIHKLYHDVFNNEDVGMVNSNTLNFPVVVNGEEGWVEIVVKVTKDDGDDGYLKRDEYVMKCNERVEKAKASAEKKAKKIARDKKLREEKKKEKEGE